MGIMSSVPARRTTTSSFKPLDPLGEPYNPKTNPVGMKPGMGTARPPGFVPTNPYPMPKPRMTGGLPDSYWSRMSGINDRFDSLFMEKQARDIAAANQAMADQQNQYTLDEMRRAESESRRQSGLAGAGHALDAQHYKDMFGFDMQTLGIKRQGLGIDIAATGRDEGFYNTAYDQSRRAYDEARGILTRRRTANDANWAGEQAYNATQQGFLARLLDQSTRRSNVQLAQSGGGTGSTFNRDNVSDYTLENDQGKATLAEQLRGAQQSWQNQITEYDQTGQGLDQDLAGAGLTRDSRIAESRDKAAQLALQGNQFGVDEDALRNTLGFNLAKTAVAAKASRAPAGSSESYSKSIAPKQTKQQIDFKQKLDSLPPAERLQAIKFVTYASGDQTAIANFERMFGVPSSAVDPRVRVNAGW